MKKLLVPLLVLAALICAAFAADITSEQVTLEKTTRLALIQVTTTAPNEASIRIVRETVTTANGVVITTSGAGVIDRTFANIATQEVTLAGGKTLKAIELYEAMVLFAAKWKTEDDTPSGPAAP